MYFEDGELMMDRLIHGGTEAGIGVGFPAPESSPDLCASVCIGG
jgi:hypothetical protein